MSRGGAVAVRAIVQCRIRDCTDCTISLLSIAVTVVRAQEIYPLVIQRGDRLACLAEQQEPS